MRLTLTVAVGTLWAAPALAGQIDLGVEIPALPVAEYHRPYVGIWVERPDASVAAHLALWYDHDMAGDEGRTWLKDLRQWWRRIGRSLPPEAVDGASGPTRAPGTHSVSFRAGDGPLPHLPAGDYVLVVEAAREVGGRELLRLPFRWPADGAASVEVAGEHELGRITLAISP